MYLLEVLGLLPMGLNYETFILGIAFLLPFLWWLGYFRSFTTKEKLPLPPSPMSIPWLGHLPLLASASNPAVLMDTLAQKYGPIYHLKLGPKIAIVISNEILAKETLIKKGKVYAGRWGGKVLMWNSDYGADLAMAPYGEQWKKLRKVAHKILIPSALTSMDPILEAESLRLLQSLAQSDGNAVDIKSLFLRFTCNIILSKSMGMTFSREDDPTFLMICEALTKIFELAGVGGLEDYFDGFVFDWLEKKKIRLLKPYKDQLHDGFVLDRLKSLKANLESEGAEGRILCYAEELLLNMEQESLTLNEIKILMLDFLLAGMDTTATTLDWIFIYLANEKELQIKAYDEIKQVTDQSQRLVTFEDMVEMPYIRGIIKETLRLHPPGPLGLPRSTTEEDELSGYFIPKGAQVIYNIPGIHASMEMQTDSFPLHQFQPERHMNEKVSAKENEFLHHLYSFGQGRRICPGFHLAFREMFLVVSNVIRFFHIENANAGKISLETKFGLTVSPKENFKLKFNVRSPIDLEMINEKKKATSGSRPLSLTVV